MKYILKISIALMCCSILMFNFIGCNKNEKNALEYLSNKYGQEFELKGPISTGPGGDEFHPSKIKITRAWPKDNPDEVFNIVLDSEGVFYDDYQNIILKPYVDEYLKDIVKQYWNTENIKIDLDYGITEKKFEVNDCLNFLIEGNVQVSYIIYLKYDYTFNIDDESEKIYELYEEFKNRGLGGYINVSYIMDDIKGEKIQDNNFWNDLMGKNKVITYSVNSYYNKYQEGNDEVNAQIIKSQLEKNKMDNK